ncbi:MAG: Fe-Mn family superoxide dismutase [Candidatus Paceibacterota bacterium]|jgi:Fe-Mn family superoxide dismutase
MSQFTPKQFKIPKLIGISPKNIEEHLKLYSGYVTNTNLVLEKIKEYKKDAEKHSYVLGELTRRFSFEYNGMRNHEIYFSTFEGGPSQMSDSSPLKKKIVETWGSFEIWLAEFKAIGLTRGIGWAVLWYDPKHNGLLNSWVDEQHLGQLNGCSMILAMDMWEHSYVADYQSSGKKKYVEDFFANMNWSVIEDYYKKSIL